MLGWVPEPGEPDVHNCNPIKQKHAFCLQLSLNFLKYNYYPCSKNPQLPQRPDHIKFRALCLNLKAFSNPVYPIHLCCHLPHQGPSCPLLPVPCTALLTCTSGHCSLFSVFPTQCPLLLLFYGNPPRSLSPAPLLGAALTTPLYSLFSSLHQSYFTIQHLNLRGIFPSFTKSVLLKK